MSYHFISSSIKTKKVFKELEIRYVEPNMIIQSAVIGADNYYKVIDVDTEYHSGFKLYRLTLSKIMEYRYGTEIWNQHSYDYLFSGNDIVNQCNYEIVDVANTND